MYESLFLLLSLELLQYGNPFLRRWMGGEKGVHKVEQTVLHLVWLADEELSHVGPLHIVQAGIGRNLSQCGGQGKRIATEFGSSGVGHVLALAADGKSSEKREDLSNETAHESNDQNHNKPNSAAVAVVIVITVACRAKPKVVVKNLQHYAHHR